MKDFKAKSCLLIAFLLCLTAVVPLRIDFANKYSELDYVTVFDHSTGRSDAYDPVSLTVFGKDVFSDTPGVAIDGRVLVPIAAIFKSVGVEYKWYEQTKEIAFESEGRSVVVQIGNPNATVNGKKVPLPDGVAPRIMTYKDTQGVSNARTYVPVRFVSEMLGLDASWIGSTRTVAVNKPEQVLSNVDLFWKTSTSRPFPEIRLKVSGEVDYTSFVAKGLDVGGLDQTVIDFQNTRFTMPEGGKLKNGVWTYDIGDGIFGLNRVEVEQTETEPARTRVTIYKSKRQGHDIYYDAKTGEMVVRLINTVDKIDVQQVYETNTVVIDTGEENAPYNIDFKGDTLYVDLVKSVFNRESTFENLAGINRGKIKSITSEALPKSTYGYESVRVAIKLSEPINEHNYYVEQDPNDTTRVLVYVPDDAINMFKYVKTDTYNSQMLITLEDASYQNSVSIDEAAGKVVMRIPAEATNLNLISEQINDNLVKSVTVELVNNVYVVTAKLDEGVTKQRIVYENSVGFLFENKPTNVNNSGTLIVIDPGHGGNDPGTVGSKGTEEEVVLQTSMKLKLELEKLGYSVYMTRTKDEYVNLYDRPVIANSMNAAVFVSVHANGFKSSSANGIEVYYGDSEDKKLADIMQKKLIGATGATNRGAKPQPRYVVIKNSTMPTVLVELGFMTNATEESNLMSDNYQQKLAKAMAESVHVYLK